MSVHTFAYISVCLYVNHPVGFLNEYIESYQNLSS